MPCLANWSRLGVSTKDPWQAKSIHPKSSAMMKRTFGFFAHRAAKDPIIQMANKQKKSFIAAAPNLFGRPGKLVFFTGVPELGQLLDFVGELGCQII